MANMNIYSAQARKVVGFIAQNFGAQPEFLWEKFPDYAAFRRADNGKWFAALLKIPASKIGLPGDELIDILDLKGDPGEIELMVDGRKIFKGYHMNKRHWFTICLDGRMGDSEIKTFVRESYERVGGSK